MANLRAQRELEAKQIAEIREKRLRDAAVRPLPPTPLVRCVIRSWVVTSPPLTGVHVSCKRRDAQDVDTADLRQGAVSYMPPAYSHNLISTHGYAPLENGLTGAVCPLAANVASRLAAPTTPYVTFLLPLDLYQSAPEPLRGGL